MDIALTYTGSEEKHDNYVRWLEQGEKNLRVVRLSAELANAGQLAACDGLVLSGGVDSHPDLYHGRLDYPNRPAEGWNLARDQFEKDLYLTARQGGIPILGICRGLQLINILEGGDLIPDLGPLNDTHRRGPDGDRQHALQVVPGTLLAEVTGLLQGAVNSAHHQAIGRLGRGLLANARAGDGTIEGLEWADRRGKPFLLAVQWHPERMYQQGLAASPLASKLRDRFLEEARRASRNRTASP
ncbi:MAG TPA: gamma-glutamyl-gamma-aminobutyrate hydrolase family protein [Chitinophagaceae bacterium]|nr:gamma-glutamyl-gamma-aminobutyrate hydrolase family protein [Chitinophagaceae bacterium]